jgi:hypothetical protein
MIVDNTNGLLDSQAITATAASTNIIDVGAAGTAFGAAAAVAATSARRTKSRSTCRSRRRSTT